MTGDPRDRFDDWTRPRVEDGKLTEYNWIVHRPERLHLGKYVDVAAFTVINAHAGVTLEPGVQIGPHCDIHSKSTIDDLEGPVVIREGARIGSHSTVLPNVEIGRGSVVGAHSLVRDDVPADAFVAGVPAERKD